MTRRPVSLLLSAAEQSAEHVAQSAARTLPEQATENPAEPAGTAAASEESAQYVPETSACLACTLRLRLRSGTAARHLLGDVRQHDRREDRQQLLHEVAAHSAAAADPAECARHLVTFAAEDVDTILSPSSVSTWSMSIPPSSSVVPR